MYATSTTLGSCLHGAAGAALELHAGKVPLPSVSISAAAKNSWLFTYFEVSKASVQQQARGYTEYRQTLKLNKWACLSTLHCPKAFHLHPERRLQE